MAFFNADDLKVRLRQVSPLGRTALAAAAAERANPVYEKHWVGDHITQVREAIDWAWSQVAGAPPDPARVAVLDDAVQDQVTYFGEEEISILVSAAGASLYTLQTLDADADKSVLAALRTLAAVLHVAQLAAQLSETVDDVDAKDEELTWQERALQLVTDEPGPWTPEMFRALGNHPPAWWVAYEAGSHHLI